MTSLGWQREAALRDAYAKIRSWYQANVHLLDGKNDIYSEKSRRLILRLPDPATATPVEMRAVMNEVIGGMLEWAFTRSDGEYTMSEYAREATRGYGGNSLEDSEIASLATTSSLWPYLNSS